MAKTTAPPQLWPDGTKLVKLTDFKINPDNPRFIRDDKFEKLVNSILKFPKMLSLRKVTYQSEDGIIIGGTMRFEAFNKIGWKAVPAEWFQSADDLTPEEVHEFIIKDNVGFGEWDWEALANGWEESDLKEWGMDLGAFTPPEKEATEGENKDYPDDAVDDSYVKMVQLYLSVDTEIKFREFELKLRERFGSDNLTDTVYRAMKHLAEGGE